MKSFLVVAALVLLGGCGGAGMRATASATATYGHSAVEACSSINYLRTMGEDLDTVPANIRPVLTDSPLRDQWAAHYAAMLVAFNEPGDDPSYDVDQARVDSTGATLSKICAKAGVTLVGDDQDYFLPSY